MSFPLDDLKLYSSKKFRSSNIVMTAWNCIESKLLYALGLSDNLLITIFIDNDTVILTVSTDFTVVCSVRKTFYVDHVLIAMSDIAITTTIKFIYLKKTKIKINKRA